jgi:hypothetical protein
MGKQIKDMKIEELIAIRSRRNYADSSDVVLKNNRLIGF